MTQIRSRPIARLIWRLGFLLVLIGAGERLDAQEKSFLWKVQSDKNTIYILGSIHFMKKENYPLKTAVEQAFESVNKLVFEIDLQSAEPEKMQGIMLQQGINRGGKNLQDVVSKGTYSLVAQRVKEMGLDIRALASFKPWVVALTLTSFKLQQLGFDPKYGVDRYFFDRAQAANKQIIGLETFEYQFSLLDQLSPRIQELMLLQTLKELDVLDKGLNLLVRSWLSGGSQELEGLMLGSFKEYPELYQRIILDRNQRWLSQIEKFLSQGEVYMVVVGAGHLVGKGSVIELLRERGYRIEQL